MTPAKDPTDAIRKRAATFAGADLGSACTQSSFKVGKTAFLYIGPGAKGQGYKLMLKLDRSFAQAEGLAAKEPDRYTASANGWVTVRFTAERPLAKSVWEKWLKESYEISAGGAGKAGAKKTGKKSPARKTKAKKTGARAKATKKKAARKR